MEQSIITTKIEQADQWIAATTLQHGSLAIMLSSIQADLQKHLDEDTNTPTALAKQIQAAIIRLEQKISEINNIVL